MPELVADEDGNFPDPRDLLSVGGDLSGSPFSMSTSASVYSGSASGSPREFMSQDNESVLRHLGKGKKVWNMGKRGKARFVRINHQWHIKFLDSGEKYPVIEEAGALCVEFTERAYDYIMEIGDSADDASEYIVWKGNGRPLSPVGSSKFKYNSPRTWVALRMRNTEERTQMILHEAKYAFMAYESTVISVEGYKGRTLMWSTVPKELKHKYNCTDLKTIGQWRQVEDYGMDLNLLKPGMKIKMVIMGAVAGGKYSEEPQLNGVPDPQLWGHYIMSQVGPKGFSYNLPQGKSRAGSRASNKGSKEPTFPKKIYSGKRKDRKKAKKISSSRFAKPVKITPPPKQPPKLSDEESFPALGAAPKRRKAPKPVKKGIMGRGAWGKGASKVKRNLSSKFNSATVLSDANHSATSSIKASTLSNTRSFWANSALRSP